MLLSLLAALGPMVGQGCQGWIVASVRYCMVVLSHESALHRTLLFVAELYTHSICAVSPYGATVCIVSCCDFCVMQSAHLNRKFAPSADGPPPPSFQSELSLESKCETE